MNLTGIVIMAGFIAVLLLGSYFFLRRPRSGAGKAPYSGSQRDPTIGFRDPSR